MLMWVWTIAVSGSSWGTGLECLGVAWTWAGSKQQLWPAVRNELFFGGEWGRGSTVGRQPFVCFANWDWEKD